MKDYKPYIDNSCNNSYGDFIIQCNPKFPDGTTMRYSFIKITEIERFSHMCIVAVWKLKSMK